MRGDLRNEKGSPETQSQEWGKRGVKVDERNFERGGPSSTEPTTNRGIKREAPI